MGTLQIEKEHRSRKGYTSTEKEKTKAEGSWKFVHKRLIYMSINNLI